MNILMANWTWYPSGGDWTYVDSVCDIYRSNGDAIIPFSMENTKNYPTQYSDFFIDHIDYKIENKNKNVISGLRVLGKSIYSIEAKRKLKQLLDTVNIDIAQLNGGINNYLTPSIIPVLKKRKIPVVWRILDYKLICPNTTFVSNNEVCEACYKHKYYNCVLKKCKKQSFRASLVAALESYTYFIFPFYKQVDKFLFQSEFTRDLYVKYGFDKTKTHIIENPYSSKDVVPQFFGKNYILYFGRIETLKGIYTLLDAMKKLPDITLKIVGNGSEYENSINYAKRNKILNVHFTGPKWGDELVPILRDAEFVVVPSEWYEPSPYAALQSLAYGKPIIASNIGGLKDIVCHKENGLLFQPGNVNILCQAISELFSNKKDIERMGICAAKTVERNYNPKRYYENTMELFHELIKAGKK
ncbi:glycosyltransferase family 4 protein [uncultured Desulfobacter sp.]|uniref:glycosyltransferase family 4 protein n=1 Tax=uncultured Desulfobacter sp. TaxID=240139 RepID=UPI002AA88D62|nr:glycosyltransferase family 4 protein [uncultured Desulfobacter sp.]